MNLQSIAWAVLALVGTSPAWADPNTSVSNTGVVRMAPASGMSFAPGFTGTLGSQAASTQKASRVQTEVSAVELARQTQRYRPVPLKQVTAQPESVVGGTDTRFRIMPRPSGYPYRAVGQITFDQGDGSYICTGWLISPDTVATAGHCVHEGGKGGHWSTNVVFTPGRNANQMPFGSCNAIRLETVQGWTQDGDADYDYAAIRLDCRIGESLGYFGRQVYADNLAPVLVLGYPGDKTFGTLWGGAGQVDSSLTLRTRYRIDTYGGQSGGVVVRADGARNNDCQGACAIAVHAYGNDGSGRNSGTRITQQVFDNFQLWIDTP